jgi:hypothetical protein
LGVRADLSSCAGIGERELEVGLGQGISGPFRPLDQANAFPLEVVGQTGVSKFTLIKEPIKIKVVQV